MEPLMATSDGLGPSGYSVGASPAEALVWLIQHFQQVTHNPQPTHLSLA